jgi:protein-S-isoprenylcysteine O-methyltransferase Ste14
MGVESSTARRLAMSADYLLLALLWTAYCAVHSALISIRVTGFFKRMLGAGYRFYRLAFNVFSIVTFVPLIMYSRSSHLQNPPLFTWGGRWRALQYGLAAPAALLILSGARRYNLRQFLGIEQIRGATNSGENFETGGVLGLTRHPWYLAVFILIWVSDLNFAAITINVVLSVYLVIGTLLEERKLVLEFGDSYRRYQEQVSMFIPIKWLRRKVVRRRSSVVGKNNS